MRLPCNGLKLSKWYLSFSPYGTDCFKSFLTHSPSSRVSRKSRALRMIVNRYLPELLKAFPNAQFAKGKGGTESNFRACVIKHSHYDIN